MGKIGVIVNANAGSALGQRFCEDITELFQRHGAQADVRLVTKGARLRKAARDLREEGFDTIVASGGDGTVSAVASELVGTGVRLGVLPLGTLNHFARDLGVPLELDEAIKVVCSGDLKRVDVGAVNGLTFINNSSLGLYPDQVRVREKWRPRLGKWLAMLIASLVVLTRFPLLRVTAEFGGARIKRRCPLVLIGNNAYKLEPRDFIQRERLDCGRLGVYFLRDEGRAGLLRLALHSLVFRLDEDASFENYTVDRILLATGRRRIRVALDGEVSKLRSPLRYNSVPGGLHVIVPKQLSVAGELPPPVER
jgi:diacylglycerol kinase family enzyme